MTRTISTSDIAEMRAWLADCEWADAQFADYHVPAAEWLADYSDYDICRAIERHYAGGLAEFLQTVDDSACNRD